MPQLDTIYLLMIFLWTWLMLYLTTKKINMFLMTTGPKKQPNTKNKKQTPTLLWT
uniref:ATP synthase F0 subunit 8 n=1 Tax=Opisthotropis latouchii TaxID=763645 RepID=A0A6G7L292_9SAUR|nr:ATP synthase F0 subunit 8 [Opisthotropis latouchii]QII91729.1 ATP synthase F0 subunit 8 [Opisthotropis latouchii]